MSNNVRRTSFSHICIEGDSHARHIAGLMKTFMVHTTKVVGMCKPGAKLLDVTSGSAPPPGSCCILIAGTNDVAAREQDNIFRYMEQQLASRLKTATTVIVATVPHRHDLSKNHSVNKQVKKVNTFLEQLCEKSSRLTIFDFNEIRRSSFTRHGMHLSMSGKIFLARLLVDAVIKADSAVPVLNKTMAEKDDASGSSVAMASTSSLIQVIRTLSEQFPNKFPTPSHNETVEIGDNIIGQGTFGKVFIGILSTSEEKADVTYLAVKKIDLDLLNDKQYNLLKKETLNMRDVRHPKLVSLLHCFVSDMCCLMVTPLMNYMSCDHIIATNYPNGLSEGAIGMILKHLLQGLSYLHSKNYIHRGIKASHILVNIEGHVKLCGFRHMIKLPPGQKEITDPNALVDMSKHLNWLAPEMLQQNREGFGLKSDVYSIGMTVLELGNGVVPHSDVSPPGILVRVLNEPPPRLWDRNFLPSSETKMTPETQKQVVERDIPYRRKQYSRDIVYFVSQCVMSYPGLRAGLQDIMRMKFITSYAKQVDYTLVKHLSKLGPPALYHSYETAYQRASEENDSPEWDFSV